MNRCRLATLSLYHLAALCLLPACYQDIVDADVAYTPEPTTGSTSGAEPTGAPTTSAGVQSATSNPEITTGGDPQTTNGDPNDPPPKITSFQASPSPQTAAGPAELQLEASADVVKVVLTRAGGTAETLTLADFPYPIVPAPLSAADNTLAPIHFDVLVEDLAGQQDLAGADYSIELPASGALKCLYEDLDMGAVTSVVSALLYLDDAIVAVGSRDIGKGMRLAVWKLDPKDCTPLPGWPVTLANWTNKKPLSELPSTGTAIAVDDQGTLLVGGNLSLDGKPQSYLAGLDPATGSRLWEQEGQVGDELAGLAAATGQFHDRIFVVGSRRTSHNPVRTDAAIWAYQVVEKTVFIPPATILKAPFTPDESDKDVLNNRSERARAVIIPPGKDLALVVGDREFFDKEIVIDHIRGFTAHVHPLGGIVGTPWTSWAPAFLHDSIQSVTLCGEGKDVIAGGWTRDDLVPNAKPQPLMLWLAEDGQSTKHRHDVQLSATQTFGIACDREGKIFSAATQSTATKNAQVFTVLDQNSPRTMYDEGADGDDAASAASCDKWGYCAWGGFRTDAGQAHAVVSVHHP